MKSCSLLHWVADVKTKAHSWVLTSPKRACFAPKSRKGQIKCRYWKKYIAKSCDMGSCGRTRTSEVNFQRKIPPQCSEKKRAPNESETLSPEDSRVLKSTQLLNPTKTTTKTHSKWRQATTQLRLSPSNELLTPTLSCSLRALVHALCTWSHCQLRVRISLPYGT